MEKLTFNGVDIFNPIADKMDKIIDYFVMFYGEKYRARIEEKLKTNTTYIFMPKLAIHNWKSTYRNNMMDLIFEEEDILVKKIQEKLNINIFSISNRPFKPHEIETAKNKWINGEKLTKTQKEIINRFVKSCTNNNTVSKSRVISKIDKYLQLYREVVKPKKDLLINQQAEIISNLQVLIPDVKKIDALIEDKKINEITSYFLKIIAKFKRPSNIDEVARYGGIFMELLGQESLPLITTSKQKKEYVSLFKFLGINYGDNYADYYKNKDKFEHLIFDKQLKEKLEKIQEEKEYLLTSKNEFFCNALQVIEGLNIKYPQNKKDILEALYDFVYEHGTEAFTISYIEEGTNEIKQICICRDYISVATDTIIHEMNHLLEEDFLYETEELFCTKSGFDILPFPKFKDYDEIDLSVYYKDEITRKYELLNEIINDFFANSIFEYMEHDNFVLGLGENYCSYYRDAFPVFGKLICDNKEKIIDARLSRNMAEITKYITKEEFDKLAEIANELLSDDDFMDTALDEIEKLGINVESWNTFATIDNLKGAEGLPAIVKKMVKVMCTINHINQKMQSGKNLKMWSLVDETTRL